MGVESPLASTVDDIICMANTQINLSPTFCLTNCPILGGNFLAQPQEGKVKIFRRSYRAIPVGPTLHPDPHPNHSPLTDFDLKRRISGPNQVKFGSKSCPDQMWQKGSEGCGPEVKVWLGCVQPKPFLATGLLKFL